MKTLVEPRERDALLRRLRTVRAETRPLWGRMTSHQMVCHVSDAFLMGLGEKPAALDTSPFKRTALKWIVLYAPLPWPHGIRSSPELDQELGGTPPLKFASDLARAAAMLDVFASSRELDRRAHPFFDRMSTAEWLRWGWLHTDHHLRQFGA